jgi:hypothetical protein
MGFRGIRRLECSFMRFDVHDRGVHDRVSSSVVFSSVLGVFGCVVRCVYGSNTVRAISLHLTQETKMITACRSSVWPLSVVRSSAGEPRALLQPPCPDLPSPHPLVLIASSQRPRAQRPSPTHGFLPRRVFHPSCTHPAPRKRLRPNLVGGSGWGRRVRLCPQRCCPFRSRRPWLLHTQKMLRKRCVLPPMLEANLELAVGSGSDTTLRARWRILILSASRQRARWWVPFSRIHTPWLAYRGQFTPAWTRFHQSSCHTPSFIKF